MKAHKGPYNLVSKAQTVYELTKIKLIAIKGKIIQMYLLFWHYS